jgi:hypothetical protein
MKADPDLSILPVAMWTIASPTCDDYVERSFKMGCSGSFTKPVDSVRMEFQVRAMLEFYWWAWSHPRSMRMRGSLVHGL